ncbi:MAG: CBS domain-containing protein [Aliidongia sp.]
MNARDIMTTDVISVTPEMPIHEIAKRLLKEGVSAVPVVDDGGVPIGMVSEGDLIGRDETEREARRDWWLALLAEGEALHPDFLASLHTHDQTARDVMSSPVVTVGEETDIIEIARLLAAHRVKRVPVMHDGRIVGIVSRADLLRALVAERDAVVAPPGSGFLASAFAELDVHFHDAPRPAETHQSLSPRDQPDEEVLSASDFQGLLSDFEHKKYEQIETARLAGVEQRRQRVIAMIDQHVSDDGWRILLHKAREAAEQGLKQLLLLRFPSELCSDGGRAINVSEADWPSTLRAEAAETYLRWERDLKPRGFRLAASVVDFPGGMPGDIGLFLNWGELATGSGQSTPAAV